MGCYLSGSRAALAHVPPGPRVRPELESKALLIPGCAAIGCCSRALPPTQVICIHRRRELDELRLSFDGSQLAHHEQLWQRVGQAIVSAANYSSAVVSVTAESRTVSWSDCTADGIGTAGGSAPADRAGQGADSH